MWRTIRGASVRLKTTSAARREHLHREALGLSSRIVLLYGQKLIFAILLGGATFAGDELVVDRIRLGCPKLYAVGGHMIVAHGAEGGEMSFGE